jgi:hypothetical protein
MVTPVSGVNTWLKLNGQALSFNDDEENLEAGAKENSKNILQITSYAPDNLQISVDDEPVETYRYGRWDWYPEDYAGLYVLEVSAPGYPLLTANVRVLPGKLTYAHYQAMLNEISEIAADLLFSVHSPVGERVIAQFGSKPASALREYQLIQPIVYQIGDTIAQIRRNPYRQLQEYTEQRLLYELHQFSSETIPVSGAVVALPEAVASAYCVTYLPESWSVQRSALTYDVYENRLLKHFVQRQLVTKLTTILERATAELKRREQNRKMKLRNKWEDDETPKIEELEVVVEECQKMIKWCIAWSSEPFLKQVKPLSISGKATQVLLKNPFYSRFYHLYLQFQQELKISLNAEKYLTSLALRKMSDLYEIWSVFQLTDVILQKLTAANYWITSNSIFYELEQDQFQFDVRKNVASIVLAKDDFRVEIKYEPMYPKQVSILKGLVSTDYQQLTPDMSVEIYQQKKIKHVIIFDAKYRYQVDNGEYRPKEDDLNKVRKYRDLIRSKEYNPRNPNQKPQKIVSSAYILYPGTILDHDEEEPEIGALPLVPEMEHDDRLDMEDAVEGILWFAGLV